MKVQQTLRVALVRSNRIDPSGVSEVSITRQGSDRIVVQAPGQSDPELLRRRIGQTARLTFHEVDQNADLAAAAEGRLPAKHLEQDAAQRVHIGPRVDLAGVAALLG